MGVAEIFALILGFFKFFSEVSEFIKMLQGTPAEQRQKVISEAFNAMRKAKETGGDTSDIEDILNG